MHDMEEVVMCDWLRVTRMIVAGEDVGCDEMGRMQDGKIQTNGLVGRSEAKRLVQISFGTPVVIMSSAYTNTIISGSLISTHL